MIRPTTRRQALRAVLSLGLAATLTAAGCDDTSKATGSAIPFDPEKTKSQEDSMKKAAEESLRAAKAQAKSKSKRR